MPVEKYGITKVVGPSAVLKIADLMGIVEDAITSVLKARL